VTLRPAHGHIPTVGGRRGDPTPRDPGRKEDRDEQDPTDQDDHVHKAPVETGTDSRVPTVSSVYRVRNGTSRRSQGC
jgi:hypothetical protein